MSDAPVPHFKYRAMVKGRTVYAGDDLLMAMRMFETLGDAAAVQEGSQMVFYMHVPHMVVGQEKRPVIQAHAAGVQGLLGALYGVEWSVWNSRPKVKR